MNLDVRKCTFQTEIRRWIRLKRYATLCELSQKESVHAFGGPNVDRHSDRIDKVSQQANFWFAETRSLPRFPFQQHALRSDTRQSSPQHAIDLMDYCPVHYGPANRKFPSRRH